MDMTMKCLSSIKNLPLCLFDLFERAEEERLNWKEKNCVSVKSGKQEYTFRCCKATSKGTPYEECVLQSEFRAIAKQEGVYYSP